MKPHRHRWIIHKQEEQPSPGELFAQSGGESFEARSGNVVAFYTRPVIMTYRCIGCGSEKVVRV